MKLVKSLLLGSAAGLVAAAGAQAADLPTKKAAPVEYVRICAVHGPGFFYIPGSDTCIRISGRARFEYVGSKVYNLSTDPSSFYAVGRIAFDARTQTDWGLLRAYMRFDFNRRSGNNYFGSGSAARGAYAFGFGAGQGSAGGFPSFSGQDTIGNRLQTGVGISAAFVQWGGLTAGRIQSFYDFYADNDTWFGTTDSDVLTQALAYTYTFGSGFSATLSIEDPKERQKNPVAGNAPIAVGGINSFAGASAAQIAAWNNVFPIAFSPFNPLNFQNGLPAVSFTQREDIPDIVGVLRVDQGWGSAQLSGAYHRISTSGSTVTNLQGQQINGVLTGGTVLNTVVPSVAGGFGQVDGNAWAIQGGVKINLPMIAAGDTLYLQAAYSRGNLSYVNSGFPSTFQGLANGIGGTTFATYDAVVGPFGHLTLTPAYSAVIAFTHYWTPTLRSSLVLGGEHVSYSNSIRNAAGVAQGTACPTCIGTVRFTAPGGGVSFYNPFNPNYVGGTQYNASGNLIWSPIKDLDIGVEVVYYRNQMSHSQYDVNAGNGKTISNDQAWDWRLRISRDF
jgi:Porin subfamily